MQYRLGKIFAKRMYRGECYVLLHGNGYIVHQRQESIQSAVEKTAKRDGVQIGHELYGKTD